MQSRTYGKTVYIVQWYIQIHNTKRKRQTEVEQYFRSSITGFDSFCRGTISRIHIHENKL